MKRNEQRHRSKQGKEDRPEIKIKCHNEWQIGYIIPGNMENIIDSLVADLWSFHLAVIGVMVSVMTLLYASISSKEEELNSIKHSKEYTLMNRSTAIQNTIGKLRVLNNRAMLGLIFALFLFIISTILKYLPQGCVVNWLVTIDALLSFGVLIYCALFAHDVYSQYQTKTA